MNLPNKKDLSLLKKLLRKAEELEILFDDLTPETQEFLRTEFTGETKIHLYNFDRNLTDTIRELEN